MVHRPRQVLTQSPRKTAYYKGPAQELVGLDGNVYGHCYALPLNTNPIHCRMLFDDIEEIVDYFDASAYFWCKLDNIEMTDNPPY